MTRPRPDARIARVRALATLMDRAVRVPGTNVRFGLDALIGLIPGVGDVSAAAFSGYVILLASRMGVPTPVLTRMLANVAIDTITGFVPVLGDLFDVAWKSNTKNVELLEAHLAKPGHTERSSRVAVVAILGGVLLLSVGAIALGIYIVKQLF